MYTKLKIWISPTSFSDLSLNEIVEKLKVHTLAETIEITSFSREGSSQMSLLLITCQSYGTSKTCNFANYLDTALRDQFVCGLRDPRIQQELLSMKDLTVAKALERSQAMEVASK